MPLGIGFGFYASNGVFRADLGTNRASCAKIGVDPNPVIPDVKRGAGQGGDAGLVIFTFAADIKWLALG